MTWHNHEVKVTINATQTVTAASNGSQVQNVVIQNLSVGNASARVAFDLTVRRPLEALCTPEFKEAVVVLACRPDERVLRAIGLEPTLDLIKHALPSAREVSLYASIRLAKVALEAGLRDDLTSRLAAASAGNFLYARYMLDDWLAWPAEISETSGLDLPAGLGEIYAKFLGRELARDDEKWEDRYQQLLSLLAVARGEGLLSATLAGASGKTPREVDNALRACAQYLASSEPEGPFRIYHQSFRDKNDPDILPVTEAQQADALEQLAEVFQRPAVEFRRLDPKFGLPQTLHDMVRVLVPDPGLGPLLAVHFAARALADHSLDEERFMLNCGGVDSALRDGIVVDPAVGAERSTDQSCRPNLGPHADRHQRRPLQYPAIR